MTKDELTAVILESVREVAPPSLDGNGEIGRDLGRDTVLFGEGGLFDSLGLVGLIVDVEQRLDEDYEISVVLGDDRAMSQERSPFRSVATFADYTMVLIAEND